MFYFFCKFWKVFHNLYVMTVFFSFNIYCKTIFFDSLKDLLYMTKFCYMPTTMDNFLNTIDNNDS